MLHIHCEIHMHMFAQAAVPGIADDFRLKGVALRVTEPRYLMSVMTEINGVSDRKQCISSKCHVSNIDIHKSPFRNPFLHR